MRIGLLVFPILLAVVAAQDRDTLVRNDRTAFRDRKVWVYNDLGKATALARKNGKPLMVVIRCIP